MPDPLRHARCFSQFPHEPHLIKYAPRPTRCPGLPDPNEMTREEIAAAREWTKRRLRLAVSFSGNGERRTAVYRLDTHEHPHPLSEAEVNEMLQALADLPRALAAAERELTLRERIEKLVAKATRMNALIAQGHREYRPFQKQVEGHAERSGEVNRLREEVLDGVRALLNPEVNDALLAETE